MNAYINDKFKFCIDLSDKEILKKLSLTNMALRLGYDNSERVDYFIKKLKDKIKPDHSDYHNPHPPSFLNNYASIDSDICGRLALRIHSRSFGAFCFYRGGATIRSVNFTNIVKSICEEERKGLEVGLIYDGLFIGGFSFFLENVSEKNIQSILNEYMIKSKVVSKVVLEYLSKLLETDKTKKPKEPAAYAAAAAYDIPVDGLEQAVRRSMEQMDTVVARVNTNPPESIAPESIWNTNPLEVRRRRMVVPLNNPVTGNPILAQDPLEF